MTSIIANLLADLLVIALLMVTISYCWILNKRIKVLQDSKSELAQLLKYFDESTERASESIIALQTASKKIGENIQMRVDKANYLIDDLAFMIEKGNRIANQMEAGFAVARAKNRVEEPPARPRPIEDEMPEEPAVVEKPAVRPPLKMTSSREKTSATLEALLEKVTQRKAAQAKMEEEVEQPGRSRSEQELLAILKSGMKG